MSKELLTLLNRSTVRIDSGTKPRGTGFFLAEGLILTCYHVIKGQSQADLSVVYNTKTYLIQAIQLPTDLNNDLALLHIESAAEAHPCVYFHKSIRFGDELYSYGYTEMYKKGKPASFKYEGDAQGDHCCFYQLKSGQALPGLSGSPVLNIRTQGVCGILKRTRDSNSDLGGYAIPLEVIFSQFQDIENINKKYHELRPMWAKFIKKSEKCCRLSSEEGAKSKLRVFCLYEDEESSRQLYELIYLYFSKNSDVLVHGINKISPGHKPQEEDVCNECRAADAVIHFLGNEKYNAFWNKQSDKFKNICKEKLNIPLAWMDNFEIAKELVEKEGIKFTEPLPEVRVLLGSIERYKAESRKPLSEICHLTGMNQQLEEHFKNLINKKFVDPAKLERALYRFDFREELRGVDISNTNHSNTKILGVLIEGTNDCAQNLLYKRLKKKAHIGTNIPYAKVSFSNPEGRSLGEEDFYSELAKELLQLNVNMPIKFDAKFCIDIITQKLNKQDVVILFDNIGDCRDGNASTSADLRKTIIAGFWQKLTECLSNNLNNRLFIFSINRTNELVSFSDIGVSSEGTSVFYKIIVNRLPKEEFDDWYFESEEIHEEIFKKLYTEDYHNVVDKFRFHSLSNICMKLIGNNDMVVNKILDYESFR